MEDAGQVYVSGALTTVPDLAQARALYEEAGRVCEQAGLRPFVPHVHNDPERNPDKSPAEVYESDVAAIERSGLVVAFLTWPSAVVGAEVAISVARGIPVWGVLLGDQKVSRFIRGMIETGEHRYLHIDEAHRLEPVLAEALAERLATPQR